MRRSSRTAFGCLYVLSLVLLILSWRKVSSAPQGDLGWLAVAAAAGLAGLGLLTSPVRGVPSFICSPTANGGCAKIRIQADFVERFLLERIKERDDTALESVGQGRIRASLRQLQDDHYDGLLDRADFLRQSQRLRVALARPRGTD